MRGGLRQRKRRERRDSWSAVGAVCGWQKERKGSKEEDPLSSISLSLAHRIAGGSIFCWTLFLSVYVERVFLLLHRLVFSADLVSYNSRSSVQLKDAAEKVGHETLDLLLLLRRGLLLLLLLLLSTFRLLQYRSTVAGTLREIFFSFVMMIKLFCFSTNRSVCFLTSDSSLQTWKHLQ